MDLQGIFDVALTSATQETSCSFKLFSALHHGIGSYKLEDAGRPYEVLPVFEFDRDDRVSYVCIYLPALAKIGGQEAQFRCAHTW